MMVACGILTVKVVALCFIFDQWSVLCRFMTGGSFLDHVVELELKLAIHVELQSSARNNQMNINLRFSTR